MPKKGKNIYKRKDGRWEARYSFIDADGKQRHKSVYGKTYKKVKEKQEAAMLALTQKQQVEQQSETISSQLEGIVEKLVKKCLEKQKDEAQKTLQSLHEDVTIREKAEEYLRIKKGTVKETTLECYRRTINKYIFPVFGDIKVSQISEEQINEFKESLKNSHLANITVRNIMYLLNNIVMESCENDTKVTDVENEEENDLTYEKSFFTEDKMKRLIENLLIEKSDTFKMGLLIVLYTGITLSELSALQWEDVNLRNEEIYIRKTMKRVKSNESKKTQIVIEECPKRCIPIVGKLLKVLKENAKTDGKIYVITGQKKPMDNRSIQRKVKEYLETLNLKGSISTLRDSFVIYLLSQGIDIKTLSDILGITPIVFLKSYEKYITESSMDKKREDMEKLNLMF